MIRCDKYQYIKNCSTEKAYAIKYSSSANIFFLSKKYVKLTKEESEETKNWFYYWFEIPEWLYNKMSKEAKQDIESFDKDALDRLIEHDRLTDPKNKNWHDDKEICQHLKPFGC